MGMDEKLKYFNDLILKDAAEERDKILTQIHSEMEQSIRQKGEEIKIQADELLKREMAAAEKEKNNRISRSIMENKQWLMKVREEMVCAAMEDVRKKLAAFVSEPGYFPYLSDLIRKSCAQAGEGPLAVYLNRPDFTRFSSDLGQLGKELPCVSFESLEEDVVGGCRVFNIRGKVMVDNTFAKKLALSAERFFEVCRIRI